jgi:hypothetical protein
MHSLFETRLLIQLLPWGFAMHSLYETRLLIQLPPWAFAMHSLFETRLLIQLLPWGFAMHSLFETCLSETNGGVEGLCTVGAYHDTLVYLYKFTLQIQ